MIRTILLGLGGLLAAIAIGVGIHLVTRDTIALPVVRLDGGASLAPPTTDTRIVPAPATTRSSTSRTTTDTTAPTPPTTDDRSSSSTGEDNSGSGSSNSGRGRGRGRSGDDD